MKLPAGFILLVLSFAAQAEAQDMTSSGENSYQPPAYQVLRFRENYGYLAEPALRQDPFDSLKYIELGKDTNFFLTLGGELRERFEGMSNPDFGLPGPHDAYWLQRIDLFTDLHLGQRVRLFAEGISGLDEGNTLPVPPVQRDPGDLQYAFIDVFPYINGDEHAIIRVGRFGLSLGSGRLVATRAAPNIPFKFDGGQLIYTGPAWQATAFLVRPVLDSGHIDWNDNTTTFWGVYATHWFDLQKNDGVDLYYFGIHRVDGAYASGAGDEVRHSFGTRQFGEWHRFDYNAEEVLQTGTFGSQTILAWTASMDGGYTVNAPFDPRPGIKADVASGNTNPNGGHQGTFDAMYFKSGYFNDASLLRPQNIIDVHPNLTLTLTRKISLDGGGDVFWRYSRTDAIYGVPGFIALKPVDSGSSYAGTAADVNLTWNIQRHITWQASYVHFFSGSYISGQGGGDVDYVSSTLTFLF
jgi:hypothetical protein